MRARRPSPTAAARRRWSRRWAEATLTRRTLLAAAALPLGSGPDWAGVIAARMEAAPPGPALLRSYDVASGAGGTAFDHVHANCAYVYDNAVAGLALIAAGRAEAAGRIAEALALAQARDRFYTDGRLRNAYAAGPMTAPASLPGWWDGRWLEDPYQAGTATGVLAWAMLLWLATGHRDAAGRAADWIEANTASRSGFTGGVIGFEPAPTRLDWVSTEHNIDLAVGFARLGRAGPAARAAQAVAALWSPAEGRFFSGLAPDGRVNPHSAVDANLWPLLARPEAPWAPALDWVLTRHGLPEGAPAGEVDGVDFDTDRDGIWLEGTAITALALRAAGRDPSRMLGTLAAQTAPGGMVFAASVPTLTTGLAVAPGSGSADFLYYRRPHLAATAWAALAAAGVNPLHP